MPETNERSVTKSGTPSPGIVRRVQWLGEDDHALVRDQLQRQFLLALFACDVTLEEPALSDEVRLGDAGQQRDIPLEWHQRRRVSQVRISVGRWIRSECTRQRAER